MMLIDYVDVFVDVISVDFGYCVKQEVLLLEIWMVKEEIDDVLKYGKCWMKLICKLMNKWLCLVCVKVILQLFGVVGIVVLWNYFVLFVVGLLICVFVVGNCVIIKMFELMLCMLVLFEQFIGKIFMCDYVVVVNGDVEIGVVFSVLLFDYLLFIGLMQVGCYVMCVVVDNFMFVMFEFGGKLLVIVGLNVCFDVVVDVIVVGKMLNVGQICIVFDYVLLLCGMEGVFIECVWICFVKLYLDLLVNGDYMMIVLLCYYVCLQ